MGVLDSVEELRVKTHGKEKASEITNGKYGAIQMPKLSEKAKRAIQEEKNQNQHTRDQIERDHRRDNEINS